MKVVRFCVSMETIPKTTADRLKLLRELKLGRKLNIDLDVYTERVMSEIVVHQLY